MSRSRRCRSPSSARARRRGTSSAAGSGRRLRFEQLEARRLLTLGVQLAADINPNVEGARPRDLVEVGGLVYFSAFRATTGRELWRSDGTAAGTVLLKDIRPGSGDSNPTQLVNVNGTLFFAADDGINGRVARPEALRRAWLVARGTQATLFHASPRQARRRAHRGDRRTGRDLAVARADQAEVDGGGEAARVAPHRKAGFLPRAMRRRTFSAHFEYRLEIHCPTAPPWVLKTP